jgi:hypothetical protein
MYTLGYKICVKQIYHSVYRLRWNSTCEDFRDDFNQPIFHCDNFHDWKRDWKRYDFNRDVFNQKSRTAISMDHIRLHQFGLKSSRVQSWFQSFSIILVEYGLIEIVTKIVTSRISPLAAVRRKTVVAHSTRCSCSLTVYDGARCFGVCSWWWGSRRVGQSVACRVSYLCLLVLGVRRRHLYVSNTCLILCRPFLSSHL